MNVAAVAEPSAARTKNCQGLIEVSELIVQAIFEGVVQPRRLASPAIAGGRRGVRLAAPATRRKAERRDGGGADEVRHHPRQPVEAFVERRAEHLLAAVLRDEGRDDLVVRLTLIDERRELLAHLVRRRACVLAALREVLMAAAAAGADD